MKILICSTSGLINYGLCKHIAQTFHDSLLLFAKNDEILKKQLREYTVPIILLSSEMLRQNKELLRPLKDISPHSQIILLVSGACVKHIEKLTLDAIDEYYHLGEPLERLDKIIASLYVTPEKYK